MIEQLTEKLLSFIPAMLVAIAHHCQVEDAGRMKELFHVFLSPPFQI